MDYKILTSCLKINNFSILTTVLSEILTYFQNNDIKFFGKFKGAKKNKESKSSEKKERMKYTLKSRFEERSMVPPIMKQKKQPRFLYIPVELYKCAVIVSWETTGKEIEEYCKKISRTKCP